MKILVTGAGGFVGGYIADFLFKCGHEVTGLLHKKSLVKYPFKVIVKDLSRTLKLQETFEVIVHAAGSLPYKETNFIKFKQNNIDSMANLLEFAKTAKVKRIIYLSTIGIYGEFRDLVVTEESDRINLDAYGVTKYVAECLLRSTDYVEGISLRMPGIIGKGSHGVWVPNTVEKLLRNEDVKIYSPDFQTKNFVWVEDLARFVDQLTRMDSWKYNVLNLACSQSVSVREIVAEMKKLTESSSKIIIDTGIRKSFCLDNSRAVEMGYKSLSPMDIVHIFLKGKSDVDR